MANRLLGETEIEVGGRTLRLVMDFNALCAFEEATGRNAVTSIDAFQSGDLTMRELRAFMWAALQRHHPETSLQDAGDLLGSHGEALGRAMGAAMIGPEDVAEEGTASMPASGPAPGNAPGGGSR